MLEVEVPVTATFKVRVTCRCGLDLTVRDARYNARYDEVVVDVDEHTCLQEGA